MSKSRDAGWYWVRVCEGGAWGCFNWNGSKWKDSDGLYDDALFDVVGPRIPTPDEPWQCVPKEPNSAMLAAVSCPGCAATDYAHMLAAAPKP